MISERTREKMRASATSHGMSKSKIYRVWSAMVERCTNPNVRGYHRYGGRGIRVHPKLLKFENFYNEMGPTYQEGLELDRINNDGDYEPGNLRWTTRSTQANNNSRNLNILDPYTGMSSNLQELSDKYNIKITTLWYRYHNGIRGIELVTPGRLRRGSGLGRNKKVI